MTGFIAPMTEDTLTLIYGSDGDGHTFALDLNTKKRFPGSPSRIFVGKDHTRKDDYSILADSTAMQAVTCILTSKSQVLGEVRIMDPVSEEVRATHFYG